MTLRPIGFFREFRNGDPQYPSLRDCLGFLDKKLAERLYDYLSSGEIFIASPGVTFDVLLDKEVVAGNSSIYTDGVWVWPGYFAYYVKTYHVEVSSEFIDHAANNLWQIPTNIDVMKLEWP